MSEAERRKREYDRIHELMVEVEILRGALRKIGDLGHGDECIFCGFKDRVVKSALERAG